MRRIRYIPFGYKLESGSIIFHPVEGELVKLIYHLYLCGKSYQKIAEELNRRGCPYQEEFEGWNKSTVARILKNRRYLGDSRFPQLVPETDFIQAETVRAENRSGKNLTQTEDVLAIKNAVYCDTCGSRLFRRYDHRKGKGESWCCKKEGCGHSVRMTDALVLSGILERLSSLAAAPQWFKDEDGDEAPVNLEIKRLNNEIRREISKPDCNEDYVKSLILACAAEKFACCDEEGGMQVSRIRKCLQEHVLAGKFDKEIFGKVVARVLVGQDGTVRLELKNGHIL